MSGNAGTQVGQLRAFLTVAEASVIARAQAGMLRVGVTPAVSNALHPRLAAALTDGAPGLQVTLSELRPAAVARLAASLDPDTRA